MLNFLTEIEIALNSNLIVMPLQCALSVPNICGALEHQDNRATKARCIAWYRHWMEPKYTFSRGHPIVSLVDAGEIDISTLPMEKRGNGLVTLTGDECYKFRCAMLHQGKAVHDHAKFNNIIYKKNGSCHNNVATSNEGVSNLYIDIPTFCRDIIQAGVDWANATNKNKVVIKNLARTIQLRPPVQTDFGSGPIVA